MAAAMATGEAQGPPLRIKRTARCLKCGIACKVRQASTAFQDECSGPPMGAGHHLRCFRGLWCCNRCGRYSQSETFTQGGLKKECSKPTKAGQGNKDIISKGELPNAPRGLEHWPDGIALKTPSKGKVSSAKSVVPSKRPRKGSRHFDVSACCPTVPGLVDAGSSRRHQGLQPDAYTISNLAVDLPFDGRSLSS